jgi:hypothetical protein
MALTKLITDLIDGSLGTDWQATPKTANFTAVAGEGYFVDTTSTAITVTLPSSPSAGDEVNLVDYAGTADTNNITITSSDNIKGSSDDVLINYERGGVSMVYVDATQGWIAYNAANETATALPLVLPPLTVDYLVVAGGGGAGGSGAGGGGAGGLRTSYTNSSSLNGHTESALSLSRNTNYAVTVGAGGNAGIAGTYNQTSGLNSVFSTITSTGGGVGGRRANGVSGGSGGGAGVSGPNLFSGGSAVTSPVTQGYAGGDSSASWKAGGGGGASEVGQNAPASSAGNGGDGLIVNILNATNAGTASVGEVSGSDIYFAGGGGGSGSDSAAGGSYPGGAGGIGGGGAGSGVISGTNGDDGNPNTGGGAGGGIAASVDGSGGAGGSGVVILRYPSGYMVTIGSGIIEASGSPFTEGSDKVSVFTGGTGTISFS